MPVLLPDIPRSISRDLVKHTFLSSTTSMWEVLYRHDLAEEASALPAELPVLCLHGALDNSAPFDGVLRLAAGRLNWHVTLLEGVDHHPWLRQPGRCYEAIADALDDAPEQPIAPFHT